MVGRPKSVTRKKQLAKQEQEIAITRAINEYRTEQRKDEPTKSRHEGTAGDEDVDEDERENASDEDEEE
ncbi:hypothetical protein F4604DRAFT_1921363 [Suillus subluteus]|nr:hypothetical protein F4604DRAFT_1921363 [Suillus subluteus]